MAWSFTLRSSILGNIRLDQLFQVRSFDEWAADQDPEYKKVFYTELLPELKRRGKSVVVITHDDGYFHLGDRVVKLDEGRIVATGAASFGNAAESMG